MISVLTPSIRPEGLEIVQECLAKQTYQNFEWLVEIGIPERGHDLNSAYNRMIRRAKGELIVFYQDYIEISNNGLEIFADNFDENTFMTAPVGKIQKDSIKWDWRTEPKAVVDWKMWEIDWASAPTKALKEIGGFDEMMDGHWTFDNVNVGFRADMAGYKFRHLPKNKATAIDHDALVEHPFRRTLYNPDFHNERLDKFRRGLRLPKINVII